MSEKDKERIRELFNRTMTDKEKIEKLKEILDLDIGWANPKVLIDTIRREVIDK